jgi:hypothetical protein
VPDQAIAVTHEPTFINTLADFLEALEKDRTTCSDFNDEGSAM